MFHSSDCLKGESEMDHQPERTQAGGLDRDSAQIHSVGRPSLTIGKIVAHRGVGRSAPIPFLVFHRNPNGDAESGGSDRLGWFSVN